MAPRVKRRHTFEMATKSPRRFWFGAAVIASAACASANSAANGDFEPGQSPTRWTTTLQQVNEGKFDRPDSTRDRSFGSVSWTEGPSPAISRVRLSYTHGGPERDLSWAILFGRCGTASMPVAARSNFPELDLSGGGKADAEITLALELPKSGVYHVDVYKDREGALAGLVACGNLKPGR